MSVQTNADNCLEKVKECLKIASENLQVVLEEDLEGSDEFRRSFIEDMWDASNKITQIRKNLRMI